MKRFNVNKQVRTNNGAMSYAYENRMVIVPSEDIDDNLIDCTNEDISSNRNYPAYVVEWGANGIAAVVLCPSYNTGDACLDWRDMFDQSEMGSDSAGTWLRSTILPNYCKYFELTVQEINADPEELAAALDDMGQAFLEMCDHTEKLHYYPEELVDRACKAKSVEEFIQIMDKGVKADQDADYVWADQQIDEYKHTYNLEEYAGHGWVQSKVED